MRLAQDAGYAGTWAANKRSNVPKTTLSRKKRQVQLSNLSLSLCRVCRECEDMVQWDRCPHAGTPDNTSPRLRAHTHTHGMGNVSQWVIRFWFSWGVSLFVNCFVGFTTWTTKSFGQNGVKKSVIWVCSKKTNCKFYCCRENSISFSISTMLHNKFRSNWNCRQGVPVGKFEPSSKFWHLLFI